MKQIKKKKSWKIVMIPCLVVVILSVAAFTVPSVRDSMFGLFGSSEEENTPIPNDSETEEQPPQKSGEELQIEEKGGVVLSYEPPETPLLNGNPKKTLKDAQELVQSIAPAAQLYYDQFHETSQFISANGFLFDVPANTYVKPDDITEDSELIQTAVEPNVLLLFMFPDDLKDFPGTDIVEDQGSLAIYAAYESVEGYAVASAQGSSGVISRDELNGLLALYSSDHGAIIRYSMDSTVYQDIEKAIQNHHGDDTALDFRYLAGDSKYAYAISSAMMNPAEVTSYLLRKEGGAWTVVRSGFQNEYHYKALLTCEYPDLNVGILSPCDLYYHLKYQKTDVGEILLAMYGYGMIAEDDGVPVYGVRTATFAYFELEFGKKYVGKLNEEEVWVLYEVDNYRDAENFMLREKSDPPLFIVRQS